MDSKIIHPDPQQEYWFHEGCHIFEISNSSDDPDISIARARVEPGEQTKWHALHGISERYIILKGEGIVEVDNLPATTVSVGDVVRVPADTRQRIKNTGREDLIFYAICNPRFVTQAYIDLDEPNP